MTLKLAALFALVAGSLLAWLGSAYYRIETDNERALLRADNERILRLASLTMSENLANVMSDLRFLTHNNELDDYLPREGPADEQALAREFAHIITQKPGYDQIRLIGLDGRERIRVDHAPEGARITPRDKLQDKRSRYYFQALARLRAEEIYVSPLDLNVENGQIERPLKPMIRFGVAIHDQLGVRRGYIVINYLAETLLNKLRGQSDAGHGLGLLDAQGEWLLGPENDDAWSGQLPERRARGFARLHPAAWAAMRHEGSGVLPLGTTNLQFLRVYPLYNLTESGDEVLLAQPVEAENYYWYALIANRPGYPAANHARLTNMAAKGGSVIALLILAAAYALAYAIARQRALARSLEQAVDNVPVLIAYIDADKRFRFNNRAYFDTYGITPKHLYGRHVREIFGEESYQEVLPRLEQAMSGQRVEFELLLEHGQEPRNLAITLVPDANGSVRGLYALSTDITLRRASERREREHQQELAQVSRLASVGEITSEIAHQINQPLAAIAMFSNAAQRTLEKGGDPGKLRDWMETINAQAKRAGEVVQRLRRFAHQGEIRSTPLDLNDAAREAAALAEADARARQVELILELTAPLPPVMAASILMEQVIYNLLHNAIRSAADRKRQVTIRSHADTTRVWIEILDRLPDGDPAAEEYLIEPGTEQINKGFGVGISISRGIVTNYDGDIICRQNKDGGSRVSFFLPRLEP